MANRSALSRATDSSDAPTPGYLYLDIAKNAASSPAASSEIATYLTRRLSSKQNPNIKYKCLKVLAKTAESPVTRGQFKRIVSQDAAAIACIKEALQFRGQPDPARGDEPNNRVRVAAKEALDAVYSDTPSSVQHSTANAGLSHMSSASSASFQQQHQQQQQQQHQQPRMQGIGNPMFSDPRLAAQNDTNLGNMTLTQVVSVAGETIAGMIKDPLARNVEVAPPASHSSGMQGFGNGTYGAPPPGRSQLAQQTGGQWTMASNRGPNSVVNNSEYYKARDASTAWNAQQHNSSSNTTAPSTMGGVGGSWGAPSSAPSSSAAAAAAPTSASSSRPSVAAQSRAAAHGFAPSHNTSGSGGTAIQDGSFEKNLIMELCPPGGLKAEPPPDKLASFRKSVPSLNPDLVCPALLDALEDGQPWIIRAKALCVMEVTIKACEGRGSSGGGEDQYNAYADFFHACRAEIEPLAHHNRAAIRDPAKRVLAALGIDYAADASSSSSRATPATTAPVAAPPPVPNLLDFDSTTDEPSPAPAEPPVAPPPTSAPPNKPTSNSTSTNSSLFGGMKVKSASPAAAAAPSATPATDHLLGATAPTAAPPAGGSLFGDVKVKEPSTKSNAASDAKDVGKAAAATGSAFGFINGGAKTTADSTPAPAPAEPANTEEPKKQAPPAPTKESFDPLLSLDTNASPSTVSKQTMQLSTAQMQAMAYQQMMMQQQMQMQQMQIAYAMQQQQGQQGAPMPMMQQQQHQLPPRPGSNRNVMSLHNANGSAAFSFLDTGTKPPPKEEDKKFDFVKDALKNESKK